MGNKSATISGKPWAKIGDINQWALIDQYTGQHKPFGVVMSSEGRGTMKMEGHYDIDEDVEGFFPLIKARLLGAVRDWIRQGWLSIEELQQFLNEAPPQEGVKSGVKTTKKISQSSPKTAKSKTLPTKSINIEPPQPSVTTEYEVKYLDGDIDQVSLKEARRLTAAPPANIQSISKLKKWWGRDASLMDKEEIIMYERPER
jgi:hypothetical protein